MKNKNQSIISIPRAHYSRPGKAEVTRDIEYIKEKLIMNAVLTTDFHYICIKFASFGSLGALGIIMCKVQGGSKLFAFSECSILCLVSSFMESFELSW